MPPLNTIINADCLEVMKGMPDKCIDLVLTDPPYGTTGNTWDNEINFDELWTQFYRILRGNWVVIMFGSQPFTSKMILSNEKHYRYNWVWNKKLAGNGIIAKYQPLKIHEDIVIFSKNSNRYFPIMRQGKYRQKNGIKDNHGTFNGAESKISYNDLYYPESILEFSGASMRTDRTHPTEKPIELIKYLVQTYSEDIYPTPEIIFDPFLGSGTTALACKQLKRNYIGCEISKEYCDMAQSRLDNSTMNLF